jgi:predicted ATPase
MGIVTGASSVWPQSKVTAPPPCRAARKASSVQLAGEPCPTIPAAVAAAQSEEDLISTVMVALSITPGSTQSPSDAVQGYLVAHPLLLVLDNFEQITAAAPIVLTWLRAAPGLKILCTSRVALDLYGEYEMMVSPLALPDLAHLPPLNQLAQIHAVRLFVDRIRAADLNFTLDDENALAVASLCMALDGLPLAQELAAARGRTLPPQDLLQQIIVARHQYQSAGMLLAQAKRGVDPRHRTLQEAIDWSFRLLSPAHQILFARLGVFAGGCTLDAAATICEAAEADLRSLALANLVQINADSDGDPQARVHLRYALASFARFTRHTPILPPNPTRCISQMGSVSSG